MPSLRLLSVSSLLCLFSLLSSVHSANFEWNQQTAAADWPARQMGAVECWPTRLTYLDRGGIQRTLQPGTLTGSGCPLVLWGGDDRRVGRLFTDAWVSTDAGKTWASQGDNLYQGSGNAGYSISPTSRMVKVGGSYGSSVVSNAVNPSTGARDASVYESSYWSNPGPGARSFPQITFNTRGDLYMVGGYITSGDAGNIRGDVWRSARDDCCGFWERQGDLPAPRASGFLLFLSGLNANNAQDKLLYLGGISTTGASNDVYLTVDGGYSWVTMEQAPWRGRWNQNAEVTKDGLIVMTGGIYSGDNGLKDLNDVWLSPDGGWTWTGCKAPASNRAHWSDREWLMTVVDSLGYLYVMGGSDYDGQETLSDVWRSATSLHDLVALQDQCGLPTLRSGCATYGLLCIPPTLPGGTSTIASWTNATYTVSCDACPLAPAGATSAYIAAVIFAIVFALAFAAVAAYAYLVYTRAQSSGNTAIFALTTAKTEEGSASSTSSTDSTKTSSTSDDSTTNGSTGGEESKEAYHKL